MFMNLLDRSNYFKGLLLLVKKDAKITPEEKELLLRIGEVLHFSREFCETTIADLLKNEHITDFTLQFSGSECAEAFLKDGIKMAFSDHVLHSDELRWLKHIAETNGISEQWFSEQIDAFFNIGGAGSRPDFEIEKYVVPL